MSVDRERSNCGKVSQGTTSSHKKSKSGSAERSQQAHASRRERRVSRDIVTALSQLELVSGRTDDVLCQFDKLHTAVQESEEQVSMEDMSLREQLVEIQSKLRETKAELASVSYRAEMLESERKKLRRQLSSANSSSTNVTDGAGSETNEQAWEVIVPSARSSPSPPPLSEEDVPLLLRLSEKQLAIDRLNQQLNFYARELHAKMKLERSRKAALDEAQAKCMSLAEKLRTAERKNARLEAQRNALLRHRSHLDQLTERYQNAWSTVDEVCTTGKSLHRDLAERDSVVKDVVIRCSILEEEMRLLRAHAQKLSSPTQKNSQEEEYERQIAVLQRCLLRRIIPEDDSSKLA